ncbi:MAG: DUF1080 domain-containing protein [Candidatus Hydrogenedentales bacterium]|jgi:hypothetical protein
MGKKWMMTALIAVALIAGGTTVAQAQVAEKLPTIEEAAQGWVSLFDGETLFGWIQLGDAQWKVADTNLVRDTGAGGWIGTTMPFADFELKAKIRIAPEHAAGLAVRTSLDGHPAETGGTVIELSEPKDGKGDWKVVEVKAEGNTVTATVDGKAVEGLTSGRGAGHIGIYYYGTSKSPGKVEVAELKLRPLGAKPIFNGKDLEGWNIIPDHKSEFAVIDGALNIKKGNGQIETANVYKDFVLQLAIFSNDDHLNSGVFFRGPVGKFWLGYESQVRNQWVGDDRSNPEDYGTGGNYGNQNTRKVVSSDREWFYKTLVCVGPQASVWINGYLVSDFLDMRPVSAEGQGKAGYVTGPGTIHLQGHDPKTDLSFKDIRVAEYPKN